MPCSVCANTQVSGSLTIAVGRVRKSILGDDILSVFTVGDQVRLNSRLAGLLAFVLQVPVYRRVCAFRPRCRCRLCCCVCNHITMTVSVCSACRTLSGWLAAVVGGGRASAPSAADGPRARHRKAHTATAYRPMIDGRTDGWARRECARNATHMIPLPAGSASASASACLWTAVRKLAWGSAMRAMPYRLINRKSGASNGVSKVGDSIVWVGMILI
eukprot:COSAG06_NODE_2168_length_7425_cov_2.448403_6_plen_216_part_00